LQVFLQVVHTHDLVRCTIYTYTENKSWKTSYVYSNKDSINGKLDFCLIVHHRCWQSNTEERTKCNNNLLIYKISSTCFGQSFAHLQERETEIFTAYGILLLWLAGVRQVAVWDYVVPRGHSPNPCPPQQQDAICCKNLSLTLLKMGKRLPKTC